MLSVIFLNLYFSHLCPRASFTDKGKESSTYCLSCDILLAGRFLFDHEKRTNHIIQTKESFIL